jgi:cytosine/uracil/thiamine/allantoin permease
MKSYSAFLLAVLALTLSSCEAIGDIFKTGVWTGVILVVLGIGLVIWLVSKLFGGGSKS